MNKFCTQAPMEELKNTLCGNIYREKTVGWIAHDFVSRFTELDASEIPEDFGPVLQVFRLNWDSLADALDTLICLVEGYSWGVDGEKVKFIPSKDIL